MLRSRLKKLRIACVQLCSVPCWQDNADTIAALIAEASSSAAEVVLLPENFAAMPVSDLERVRIAQPESTMQIYDALASWAKQYQLWIVGGGMLCQEPGNGSRLHNRCVVFSPDGDLVQSYHKMHLFDASVGEQSYRESDCISPGNRPESIEIKGWKIGLSICYDLRFPELYRHYSRSGCHVLLVPAAFTHMTGMVHWEPLLRSRAIENQCYVIAAGQCGVHAGGRQTWGHSMLIDSWGKIMNQAGEQLNQGKAGVICADLDFSHIQKLRQQLPALQHRRMG